MGTDVGVTRPDRLTIWPVEGDRFGIDVRWGGVAGYRRAGAVHRQLTAAGVESTLAIDPDARGWTVRLGPVGGSDVARVIDEFVW